MRRHLIAAGMLAMSGVLSFGIGSGSAFAFSSVDLVGVACPRVNSCIAAGSFFLGGPSAQLPMRWDGRSWAVHGSPDHRGAISSRFTGVSCASATVCTAVGAYGAGPNLVDQTLAEDWDGMSWVVRQTVDPPVAPEFLSAVSCPSTAGCVAVGGRSSQEFPATRGDFGGPVATLAERWDGAHWSLQPTGPNPASIWAASLSGISCTSLASCTAVGRYLANPPQSGPGYGLGEIAYAPLAERWDGSTWSVQSPPSFPGAATTELESVSCSSSVSCVAVGSYAVTTSVQPLIEQWDGVAWTTTPSLLPPGAAGGSLWGVSCPSSSACTAVGGYEMADGTGGTLAERSNGTGWAIQQTPNPPGPVVSVLLGVSCAAAATCVAVGGDLVERWNGNTWTIESIPTQEPPLLSRPRFARRRFRAAGGPKTAAPDAPVGTRIRFNLSIPAKLMITVTQTGAERLHTGACMAPTVKLARMHAKRCSRTVTIGTLTNRPLPAGRVSVRFSGRIARRALRPGEYDAVLIARGPGTFSNPVTLPFVIAR